MNKNCYTYATMPKPVMFIFYKLLEIQFKGSHDCKKNF